MPLQLFSSNEAKIARREPANPLFDKEPLLRSKAFLLASIRLIVRIIRSQLLGFSSCAEDTEKAASAASAAGLLACNLDLFALRRGCAGIA